MKRVLILGSPGSGKSTFAVRLREKTGLPLTHLDNLWWRADRTNVSRGEFDEKLGRVLAQDAWIIDGDYRRTLLWRLERADTVFFFDICAEECLAGVQKRLFTKRPDCPLFDTEADPELEAMIRAYPQERRGQMLELLSAQTDKQVTVFTSHAEADAFLAALQA